MNSHWGRLITSVVVGVVAAALLWFGTIAVILLNNVVPVWPFAIVAASLAAALYLVDLLTEGEKK
jgi:hypothetical protein